MEYKRGEHPNSRKNLEKGRFKKGEVANPRGRPAKEFCITGILREKLAEPCPYAPGKTWAEYIARRALELASENPTYFKEILDRVEGRVALPIQQDITSESPHYTIIVSSEEAKHNVERILAGERTESSAPAQLDNR
ncbi:MAG: hypothetical protein ABSF21_03395 [Dehalococcoidia bacterium]